MYTTLLTVHSLLRWLVIFAGLAAAATAIRAASAPLRPVARMPALVFTILFDIQVLVGIALYVGFSAITTTAIHQFGTAMSNDVVRFWTVEHPAGMIVALVLAHLGRARSRASAAVAPSNAAAGLDRRRRHAALYLSLAVLIAIISVPWPFMPYGRPLL